MGSPQVYVERVSRRDEARAMDNCSHANPGISGVQMGMG